MVQYTYSSLFPMLCVRDQYWWVVLRRATGYEQQHTHTSDRQYYSHQVCIPEDLE